MCYKIFNCQYFINELNCQYFINKLNANISELAKCQFFKKELHRW